MDKLELIPTLSILLPVRNEGMNLKIMLKILKSIIEVSHEVIVVVDDENDESIPIVREVEESYIQLRYEKNKFGPGAVNAIKSGVESSKGEYILILAADELGPVLAIEDMLKLMREGCGFVSGTRYKYGGRRLGGSIVSQIVSRLANKLYHFISRSPFSDLTTGIKMFSKELFYKLDLDSKNAGWAITFEMAIKAQFADVPLGEVPLISIDRLYGGQSSFQLGSWVKEYSRWFFWGIIESLKNPKSRHQDFRVAIPDYDQ